MLKKSALAALALLTFVLAYVHPVYTVRVGGVSLAGAWNGGEINEAASLARAAAGEIASGSPVPEPETSVHLAVLPAEGGSVALAKALLAETDGVQRAWNVSVDGIDIGRAADASALDEVVLAYIAEGAPAGCVSAGLVSRLELSEVFVREGDCDDLADISRRLRSLSRVSYTLGDGSVVYG